MCGVGPINSSRIFLFGPELTGEARPHVVYSLGYGAIAGVIGQTTSYPLDIVRRRMQTVGLMKQPKHDYGTIWSSLKTIYQ